MTTLYINSQTKLLCRPVKRVRHLLTALLLVMATIPSHAQFFKQIGMGDGLSNPVVLAFSSPRYFSRCFKDFYGQSPMNCRQEKKV